jgi:hypothetical protein
MTVTKRVGLLVKMFDYSVISLNQSLFKTAASFALVSNALKTIKRINLFQLRVGFYHDHKG